MERKFFNTLAFILQNLFFVFFLPIYKVFVKLEIKGTENLKNIKGPILLAPNHTSELDPSIIPLIFPFLSRLLPVYSVTYPFKMYRNSTFGWRRHLYDDFFFKMLGGYPIQPGFKDYETSLKNHISLLQNNKTVCIFPEGRCTTDGKIASAHGGLAYLALRTNATVVPLVIDTFYGVTFMDFILRRKKITMTVLSPMTKSQLITIENPTVEDFRAGSKKVLDRIEQVIKISPVEKLSTLSQLSEVKK